MLGTLLSIAIAFFLIVNPAAQQIRLNFNVISIVMSIIASLYLFVFPLGLALAWSPLQKAEQNLTPRVLEMFRKDSHVRFVGLWLILFPLITYLMTLDLIYMNIISKMLLFAVWIVMLGVAIDLTVYLTRRILNYLNPFGVVKMFTKQAKESVQNEREADLCQWIDALSEISIKAIHRNSTSLSNESLDEIQSIASLFLESSKSISHHKEDAQSKALGIVDKVSYTMFYLYQRLEVIFDKALKAGLEPVCNHVVTILGKITIAAAKYDVSITSTPLNVLGKIAKRAQEEKLHETVLTASCTFLEVSKVIINDVDVKYYEIKDPFLSIINSLEFLAKDTFRQDKTTNIQLLEQPFKDLKELFHNEKVASHQDMPVLLQNIDRVIGEFDALDIILHTIPPIPEIPEDTSSGTSPEKK
jgi:hypothetical protein